MGKELSQKAFVISLILIFLLGLSLIGGLYYYINADELGTAFKYLPVSQNPTSFSLVINSPEDNALLDDSSIVVSGETAPFASIIVVNGDQTTGFEANNNGDFSKIIKLSEGPNILQISAFDKTGASKTVTKYTYFTKEKLDDE
jgi:hypothetical protein